MKLIKKILILSLVCVLCSVYAYAGPLYVHPTNPRYFTDGSGKAIYLTGSHNWNNLQDIGTSDLPPVFDYNAYLDFMIAKNHNFMRMWAWEEAKSPDISYWSLRGWRSPNAFARTGPGNALDGKPKFNLRQFNQSYFDRLRARVIAARDKGIYVSIMLFQGCSISAVVGWIAHPFNVNNNIDGINGDIDGNGGGEETDTLSIPVVTDIRKSYIRKVIDTVNDLDNVLYEIVNESPGQSTNWQYEMINYIKSYEASKPKQHPVGMTFQYPTEYGYASNSNLFNSPAGWISPNGADGYDSNPPAATGAKVIIADVDHIWPPAPQRVWIWKCFLRGLNPILMDLYDYGARDPTLYHSEGCYSVAGQEAMRKNMGYTLTYANKMNLVSHDTQQFPLFNLLLPRQSRL